MEAVVEVAEAVAVVAAESMAAVMEAAEAIEAMASPATASRAAVGLARIAPPARALTAPSTCSIACAASAHLLHRVCGLPAADVAQHATRVEVTEAPRSSGHKVAARKLNEGGIGKSRACGVCRA
eukprot:scaffold71165_cov40-Phaeocystis_antarctica.AAC.1